MLPYVSYLYCPVIDRPLDLSVVVFCVSNIFVILFDAVEIDWRRENQRRRQALERGEALYGPESYTEEQYYTLRLDKGLLALAARAESGAPALTALIMMFRAVCSRLVNSMRATS